MAVTVIFQKKFVRPSHAISVHAILSNASDPSEEK